YIRCRRKHAVRAATFAKGEKPRNLIADRACEAATAHMERKMSRLCGAAIAAAIVLLAEMPVAQAQPRIQAGALTCRFGPRIGALLASCRQGTCRLFGSRRYVENYSGAIPRFGFDVGVTAGGVMRWRVVTRTRALGRGALAGNYVGASADASLGFGVGANV